MQTLPATPILPTPSDDQRPLALVIDDSLDVHRLLAARLKQEEIDLVCTADPREGLTRAAATPPAVILLDLDMPGMDGFEVLRALKDNPLTHHVPVIILSGMAGMQDKVTAFELGAVDYVVKPFEFTELRVRLRSALRVHRLLALLASRAQLDGLTGLWNRAYFDQRLTEEASKSARHSRPFSIAIADADNFKSINDTFGHPAGDAVLQGLAKILRRECRQSDIVCRYGGEEFVILMPDTTATDAAAVCERIRQSVEQATWPRHPERKVTISIGVAGVEGATALQPSAWLDTADRNLYASKRAGRNTVTATDLTLSPPPATPASKPSAAAA